jgi:tetratricopeptide (TPR) repeat protein
LHSKGHQFHLDTFAPQNGKGAKFLGLRPIRWSKDRCKVGAESERSVNDAAANHVHSTHLADLALCVQFEVPRQQFIAEAGTKPMKTNRASIFLLVGVLAVTGCRRTPEAKMAKFLAEGEKQLEKKDYPRAILQFRNAVQAKPKEAEPYYQLGRAYLASGDLKRAAQSFDRTIKLNPKRTDAQLKLAEILSTRPEKQNVVDAEKYATQVLSASPDNVDALNTLALTEWKLGKPEDAEQHLQQALQKFPASLLTSVNLARLKLIQKDLKGAEEVLKQAVAHAPKSPEPAAALGQLYIGLRRFPEAEQQFRAALVINPKYGPALRNLGALQMRAGQIGPAEQTYKQLSAMHEKEYKPLYALYLFNAGRHAEAIAEFQRLVKDDPADRNMRTLLVQAYLKENRVAEAEKVLDDALRKNSKDVDALLQRSRIYLASGKYTEAQADLTQVLGIRRDSPEAAEAHHLLSKVHQARGDAANRQQELTEALRVDSKYLAARLELAQVLIATNAAKSALNLLNETPENQKKSPQVVIQRNWALLDAGDVAELRTEIDRVLAVARVPEVLLQDAALKFKQKDFAGARAPLEEVLKGNPGDLRALRPLMGSYAEQKQPAAGVQKVKEYAAQVPKSAPVQLFLGGVLLGSGDGAGARKAFEAAKAAAAGYYPADLALAQLDIAEGKGDTARKSLSALIERKAGTVAAHKLLAELDAKAGNQDAAIEHYRRVLEIDPRNAGSLNNLAYLLAEKTGQTDEALKYAEQAKEIAPASSEVDDTLGWVYYRKGNYPTAVKYLETATANSSAAVRKYHLAMAYVKAGDLKQGQQTLEAALNIDSKLPEAQEALKVFAEVEKRSR